MSNFDFTLVMPLASHYATPWTKWPGSETEMTNFDLVVVRCT